MQKNSYLLKLTDADQLVYNTNDKKILIHVTHHLCENFKSCFFLILQNLKYYTSSWFFINKTFSQHFLKYCFSYFVR